MSRYSGRCGRGASRAVREQKRLEAERRNARTPPLRRRVARTGCPTGKKKYAVEADAWRVLGQRIVARTRGRKTYGERRVYDCDRCDGWHLTSKKPMTPAQLFLHWLHIRRRPQQTETAA